MLSESCQFLVLDAKATNYAVHLFAGIFKNFLLILKTFTLIRKIFPPPVLLIVTC